MPASLRDLLIEQTRATVRALDSTFAVFRRAVLDLLPSAPVFTLRHLVLFTQSVAGLFAQTFGASPASSLASSVGRTILGRAARLREAVTRQVARLFPERAIGPFWDGVVRAGTDQALRNALFFDPQRLWIDVRGYRLSDRVWAAGQDVRQAIDTRLRQGIARGESSEVIGRDLRQFLRSPKRVYQANGRIIREAGETPAAVTRAEMLARTELAQAHGAAVRHAARYIDGVAVHWSVGSGKRQPDACDDAARGSSDGLPRGTYWPEEVPRYPNHPGEKCVLSLTIVSATARRR